MAELRKLPEVDASEAWARIAQDGALVLDVREPDEWDAGRIAGALHMPLGELAVRQAELPRDRPVVVVCRSGGRSAVATEALIGIGLAASNLEGGMKAWQQSGYDLDPPDGHVA
ncbi:MAG: rhodanese-like domain-containing protein [Actinomycetia bacterium]|nr:rhodanese-like domain-containing protein [Actinomycetes bacterium]